jgi:hypothetical protein
MPSTRGFGRVSRRGLGTSLVLGKQVSGGPLPCIGKDLGHADMTVSAKHYAAYIGYANAQPLVLVECDVVSDLLAREPTSEGTSEKRPQSLIR